MKILYCSEIRGNVENLKKARDFSKADCAVLSGNLIDVLNEDERKNFGNVTKAMLNIKAQNKINDNLEVMAGKIRLIPNCDEKLKQIAEHYLRMSKKAKDESIKQYEDINSVVKGFNMPVFMVHGNHDTKNIFDFFGEKCLHRKVKDIGDVSFGGYGGSNNIMLGCIPLDLCIGFNEGEAYKELVKSDPDIAVFYHPPYGFFDLDGANNNGSFGLLAYVAGEKPNVVLIGKKDMPDVLHKEKTVFINPGSLDSGTFMEFELDDKNYFSGAKLYKVSEKINLINEY